MFVRPEITLSLDGDPRDVLVWRDGSGGTIEIYNLVVNSERRAGKGRRLVQQLCADVAGQTHLVWALTRASNVIAQQFYRALGFRTLARLPHFYAEEDAVLVGVHPGQIVAG